ncbi:MAG: SRPBCC domain-containing protein [Maricaulaceae bacterium]|jgi:uncharacterized protein YndB with AHSA1/START domain
MSENDAGETAIYRVMINAPIETVWSTLVKTDEVLPFFFGAVCRTRDGLRTGAPMAMRTKDDKFTSVVGKVLEFDPPRRYAHTMKFTNIDEAPVTVIYDLKEIDGGVEFSLTTKGALPASKMSKTMAQGGPFIVNTLKAVAEKGRPGFGAAMMLAMMGLMAPMTPKVCRTENWSFETIEKL